MEMSFNPSRGRIELSAFMSEPSVPIQSLALDYTTQPSFQDPIDPSLCQVGDTQVRPILRYLHDQHGRPFANQMTYVHPYPSTFCQYQRRANSPSSQPQLSASSSSQSPRTESDMLYDSVHGPLTPPGMISPFVSALRDPLDSQGVLAGLTSSSYADQYVDPAMILGSQFPTIECHKMNSTEDSSPYHGDGFDFYHPTLPMPNENSVDQTTPKQPNPTYQYPDLDDVDEVDEAANQSDQTIIVTTSNSEEEDTDYQPRPSRRTSARSLRQKNRGRPKGSKNTGSRVTKTYRSESSLNPLKSHSIAPFTCPQCPGEIFQDASALRKHNKLEHKRAFACIFQFAGCADGFANKNEWKRHVSTQHLNSQFWLCKHGTCRKNVKRGSRVFTMGRPFKRKDLFTQHVRRMHPTPSNMDSAKSPKNRSQDSDVKLRNMQDDACHKRCQMPELMRCSAQGCSREFTGHKAWDEHMEHLASEHIEPAIKGIGSPVDFTRAHNRLLIDWASSQSVKVIRQTPKGWDLCDPLKDISVELNDSSDEMCS